MSLKQYKPHLQLTIRKPNSFIFYLKLFVVAAVVLIVWNGGGLLSIGISLMLIVFFYIFAVQACLKLQFREFVLTGDKIKLDKDEFELIRFQVLFGCMVFIGFKQSAKKRYCSFTKDQFAEADWRRLVRYSKLAKF